MKRFWLYAILGIICLFAALPALAQDSRGTVTAPVVPLSGTAAAPNSLNASQLTAIKQSVTPTLACTGAPRTRLIVRERARVTLEDAAPLNMRAGAGTDFDVIAQIEPGEILFILEGPLCSQRYAWYLVEYEDLEGWIAEGTTTAYFVEVYPPE